MARTLAEAFARIPDLTLAAAVDSRPDSLAAFAATDGIARTFALGALHSLDRVFPGRRMEDVRKTRERPLVCRKTRCPLR